ncbi:MAG TPA: NAD(P)/FAD-dependent oxidoreductase [Rhodospirillales bacterium]|nr:NAD(P)/FAD-dependent oxidoreductase [Rhodospirillales bacterium]
MQETDRPVGVSDAGSPVPETDVVVIGGGPAGTTIGALLVEKGWSVVLLEQDKHPRFHIGESLLPMNLPILKRLGILEQVQRIGVVKHGAEFCPAGSGDRPETIYFKDAMDSSPPSAFQVRRAEFDELLFRNCAARGVVALEGVQVRDVQFNEGSRHFVAARGADGQRLSWRARFVVDASGRDTFLSRKLGLKQKNGRHHTAAIFGHFRNVVRRSGLDEGNISIYWFEHGWFWMIPLRDGLMSVGAVCAPDYLKSRKTSTTEFLWQTIRLCPEVRDRMARAEIVEDARATGNYSYLSSQMSGNGWLLVGDAYAFVDPVFSTGVFFAMNGATLAADAVDAHLHDPATAAPAFRRFEETVNGGIRTVSWFIYRFTSPTLQWLFMRPRNTFRMKSAIISMLAGDIFRHTPIRRPLAMFKLVYAGHWLAQFPRASASLRRRKRNVSERFAGGTLPVDQM